MFQLCDENLPKFCWRGRWRDLSTLWHYIQELQCASILQQYSGSVQQRIEVLVNLLPAMAVELVEADA